MRNAGRAVFQRIAAFMKGSDLIAIINGAGNNSGDRFIIARHLLIMFIMVRQYKLLQTKK